MTRSELVERIAQSSPHLSMEQCEAAVKNILESLSATLESGDRVEIRGFGSFSVRKREGKIGRNPKTGEKVMVEPKHVPHFKAGKELRERVL